MTEISFPLESYREQRFRLVDTPGVYSCWHGDQCLYVGMGFNLWRRISERWKKTESGRRWALGGSQSYESGGDWQAAPEGCVIRIWFTIAPKQLEIEKIKEFKPVHNKRWVVKPGWRRLGLSGKPNAKHIC